MTCYHPIPSYQRSPGEQLRLHAPIGTANLAIPCGKCIGCRTDRATMWADRCVHEASRWENNCFLTLTYDDEHLPPDSHLRARDLQLFIKRLRSFSDRHRDIVNRSGSAGIRYFASGEYGTHRTQRPHYHALLFNAGFRDQYRVAKNLYESPTANELWGLGQVRIGNVTAKSAAYVAQYNVKQIGRGDFDRDGVWRPPPFLRMSLRPAIGKDWLDHYAEDLRHGKVITQEGREHPLPRYYRDKIIKHRPEIAADIDMVRAAARARLTINHDRTEKEKLRAAEQIHEARKRLSRQRS